MRALEVFRFVAWDLGARALVEDRMNKQTSGLCQFFDRPRLALHAMNF